MEEEIISFLPITKMGKSKIITVPRSIEGLQPKDMVMIVKITPKILEFLKEIPIKKKIEWVNYEGRRRFG